MLCGIVQGDIIVEICDVDNQSLVNIVGLGKVTAVVSKDTVGRLMVLCARQPGLSAVWEALLGTDGEQDCWCCMRVGQSGCSQGGPVGCGRRPLDQLLMATADAAPARSLVDNFGSLGDPAGHQTVHRGDSCQGCKAGCHYVPAYAYKLLGNIYGAT